jgi:hypothetical protein
MFKIQFSTVRDTVYSSTYNDTNISAEPAVSNLCPEDESRNFSLDHTESSSRSSSFFAVGS